MIINSGLKETFYVTKTKECREKKMFVLSSSLRIPDPYLRFEALDPFLLLGDSGLGVNAQGNFGHRLPSKSR